MTLIADKQCRNAYATGFCLSACLWLAIGGIVWGVL